MERVASNDDKAETHAEHETSNKSDPPGFSLSYDGPTPHPRQGGAPATVPHAAVPRLSAVDAVGGADQASSPVTIPLNDVVPGTHRMEENLDGDTLPVPISSASASSSQVPRSSRDPRLRAHTPELRQAAAREREEQGEARAMARAIEHRLEHMKLEEELGRAPDPWMRGSGRLQTIWSNGSAENQENRDQEQEKIRNPVHPGPRGKTAVTGLPFHHCRLSLRRAVTRLPHLSRLPTHQEARVGCCPRLIRRMLSHPYRWRAPAGCHNSESG